MKKIRNTTLLFIAIFLGGAAFETVFPASTLFEERFEKSDTPAYQLEGDATIYDFTADGDTAGKCVRLDTANDVNRDGTHAGTVKFTVHDIQNAQWLRFSFYGLPGKDFRVRGEGDLTMRVKFFAKGAALDGIVKDIYGSIQRDRRDIEVNGDGFHFGSVAWPLYAFDFRIPFTEVDTIEISIGFQNGEGKAPYSSFFVQDAKLEKIALPSAQAAKNLTIAALDKRDLLPIGGKWFYLRDKTKSEETAPAHFDATNLDRLVYKTGEIIETPFAPERGAWLRKGFMDEQGQVMQEDRWLPNTIEVDFRNSDMVISSLDIPNHPTGVFPEPVGNRNHIQVQNEVVYLPLNPVPNPLAISMTYKNANRALPMGPTGIAVNGVVFYNPFDAGMEEAVNIMDRCCGHPDQKNRYHYHKYPVCTRSPFDDNGNEHSKLIGWAFDGFPVYGPYEGNGEMAMNSKSNPLNAFNIHYDKDRGWHYHVTPGKFPYIFGGYWGVSDPRNFPRHGPPGMP